MSTSKHKAGVSRWLPALAMAGLMGTVSSVALAQQAGVDFVFVVDESGSMQGEHDFLPTLVSDLDNIFAAKGFTNNRFGLIGYGDANEVARLVTPLGSAADVAAGAGTLTTSGAIEDGYIGVQFGIDTFNFRPDSTQFLLITDEDRDVVDGNLTFNSILGQLQAENMGLNGILGVTPITQIPGGIPPGGGKGPHDGEPLVVDVLNNRIYVVDNSVIGGFRAINLPGAINPIPTAEGTTQADYVDLMERTVGGCVGSIDQLRSNDPLVVGAFAGAMVDCLTLSVVNNPGSFQARTAIVLRNFFGTAQYANLVASYPSLLGLTSQNPYTRRTAGRANGTFAFKLEDAMPGAAAGATGDYVSQDGKISVFGTFRYDWGSYDQTASTLGSDFNTQSLIAGGGYALGENLSVGAALGFSNMSNEVNNNTDQQDVDAYTLYLYATYAVAQAYFDAVVSGSVLSQDTVRLAGTETIKGDTDGLMLGGQLRAGYDFEISDSFSIGPQVGLRYTKVSYDSYAETGGTAAVAVDDQDYKALVSSLGGQASLFLPLSEVYTLGLQLRGAWEHDFEDGPEPVTVSLLGSGTTFSVAPDDADDSWFSVGGGVNIGGEGFLFYTDFDTRLDYDDGQIYSARIGLKLSF